jgi:hypothetical protein
MSDASPSISSTDINVPHLLESRSRRLLELELLHYYNTRTSQTLLILDGLTGADAWIQIAPNLGLGNEALLYCNIPTLNMSHG